MLIIFFFLAVNYTREPGSVVRFTLKRIVKHASNEIIFRELEKSNYKRLTFELHINTNPSVYEPPKRDIQLNCVFENRIAIRFRLKLAFRLFICFAYSTWYFPENRVTRFETDRIVRTTRAKKHGTKKRSCTSVKSMIRYRRRRRRVQQNIRARTS